METSNINTKLLRFQQKVHAVKKDAQNPHFKSNYATLPQILGEVKPLLSEIGLILLQPITSGKVETIIICSETGDKISSDMQLPENLNPQQIGSAITYYRRYLLAGLLSLEIEDDDANAASKPQTTATSENEPTEWLNLFDKAGNKLKAYTDLESAIASGKTITLPQIKAKYKVSKAVAEQLKTNFKIQ